MTEGNIVIINGTSSAGKTSTARALQQVMEEPYLHLGLDYYTRRIPTKFVTIWEGPSPPPPAEYFQMIYRGAAPRTTVEHEGGITVFGRGEIVGVQTGPKGLALLTGMYRSIAALSAAGINVVVDDALWDRQLLRAAVDILTDLPVLFVGLRLPREVAERRERERGDRGPGGAAAFYDLVHVHAVYDLELDTSRLSPEECALRIKESLVNPPATGALRRLRSTLGSTR
jgi:chloramphenicol 3-O phosphotransferase